MFSTKTNKLVPRICKRRYTLNKFVHNEMKGVNSGTR